MRSDRDIQRIPKRPVAARSTPAQTPSATPPAGTPAEGQATQDPTALARAAIAAVPVSVKPASGRDSRDGRDDRRGPPRDREPNRAAPYGDRPPRPYNGPDRGPGRAAGTGGQAGPGGGPRGRDNRQDQRRSASPRDSFQGEASGRFAPSRDAGFRPDDRRSAPPRAPAPRPGQGPVRVRAEDRPEGLRPAQVPQPPRPASDGVRLSKILSDRGLASRREADDWIDAGWVKVNGEMAVLGQRVQPDARIEVDPAAHTQQAKRVTVLINKPIGYVSGQAEDGYEPASVLVTAANHWDEDPTRKPFHPGHARGLAPAGRLDIDSTGLLVLTQDGRVAKHLIGEDSQVEKEYLVRVQPLAEGGPALDDAGLARLRHGLELDGKQLRPAKVSWANEDQLRFVLQEGRKRQIRRMCELVGLKVTGLKRVRIGSVVLGKLPPGQWRYLRDDERF